jgi:hypothetical protein
MTEPAGQNGPEREEGPTAPPASEEVAGETTQGEAQPSESEPGRDPVRLATLVVLALCVVLFLVYLRADRIMPYSDQARVSGYTVSVTPQVSGYLTGIEVELHEVVEPGRVLVRIDTSQYQIAVRAGTGRAEPGQERPSSPSPRGHRESRAGRGPLCGGRPTAHDLRVHLRGLDSGRHAGKQPGESRAWRCGVDPPGRGPG